MQIHFFEEYPTTENLKLAASLEGSCTVFLAAQGLDDFIVAATRLRAINPRMKPAYWPILPRSYWLSPFVFPEEIEQLSNELERCEEGCPILLDLELPLLRRRLFLQNARYVSQNKAAIRALIERANQRNIPVFTAEYPAPYRWMERLQEWLGVCYPSADLPHTRIPMLYSSFSPSWFWFRWFGLRVLQRARRAQQPIMVGVGTIATGAFGNEPILSAQALSRDLAFFQEQRVSAVIIFRLGGLTSEHLHVIQAAQAHLGER